MDPKEKFLSFVSSSLEREFRRLKINELDRVDIRTSIYEIFKKGKSKKEIMENLIEYLIDEKKFKKIDEQLKKYR